jgi:hypothetical protein
MGLSPSSSRHLRLPAFWSKMFWMCIMDVGPKIAVLAEEDVEEDPDRWCSYRECGQELWQIARPLGVERGACPWDRRCRECSCARPSWAPAKEAPPMVVVAENAPAEYGPWQWARQFGAATGLLAS